MSGVRRAAAVAVAVALLGGCGDDDSSGEPPALRVDLLDDAVAAIEAELGGPQEYYEVNATPDLVNVFVATTEESYVYDADGTLSAPEPLGGWEGPTFPGDAIDVDEDAVLDEVRARLPDTAPLAFAVTAPDEGAVQYQVVMASALGGQLVVYVDGDGTILGGDLTG